ncbi:hypothetical protein AB205_0192850 [Aquarana catesbeiana]|uniref:Uncharacterized protein n=1 Tax=Aquarana catesbeiana TaxID=8400 RepID=A0A2G9RM15_AQUCT|nr:hypothetical protein AB205_0192850 [Aquarana catesbeiana]
MKQNEVKRSMSTYKVQRSEDMRIQHLIRTFLDWYSQNVYWSHCYLLCHNTLHTGWVNDD